jgi:hypothetical protein
VNIPLTEIDSERQLFVKWRQANPQWGLNLEKTAGGVDTDGSGFPDSEMSDEYQNSTSS